MPFPVIINDQLAYGDISVCNDARFENWAVIHACKIPCHCAAADYKGTLKADHPHYLSLEKDAHLYLNLIDPPVPLFQLRSFALLFDFVDRQIGQRPLLFHCNKGESRAPSLALLVMAKRLNLLPDYSYASARQVFEKTYPYNPGKGIATFLEQHWRDIE